ncbi:MAG: PAS domain S-box protein, partial [Chitinophagaceae bacterium]
ALRKKAEEAVLESERRYHTLAEISPVGIFHTDANGSTTYVNPRWCQISGLSLEEAMGDGWFNAVHEEDKKFLIKNWNEATKIHEISLSEYRFVRPDGTITWVMGQATPERNSENQIVGYVGTTTDITERKKAEETLNQNRVFIESIINASPDIVYIYDIEERKNVYINEGIQQNLYYSNEEIRQMGDKVLPILMHQDDFNSYLQDTYPKYETLKDKEIIIHEYRMCDKKGDWHWLYCKESIFLRKQNGDPKQIFGIASDITVKKKIENEILKEKQLSESIIKSLPGIFYLYDQNGKFIRWNENFKTISGYSSEEISNMHPLDFFDEDEKELLSQKIKNVFISGEDTVQANFLTKKKKKIPYYFTGIVVEYEGSPCLMGVGIDFSELVKAQEKIKETTNQLRQLTGHLQNIREEERKRIGREIHDDLGQQLTAIKMDVAWIDKKTPSESELIKTKLKNIITLLDSSNQSVRRILNELRPGILDEYGLLEALKWQGHLFTQTAGIPIVFKIPEIEFKLETEIANCIYRVYQEALTNIMRYAKAKKVFVSLHTIKDSIHLSIKDNGKGFDNRKTQAGRKTFGILGMKERVLALNGVFELTSTPAKGTEIKISLPFRE